MRHLCSLGFLNKDRLADLFFVGQPVKKVNKGVLISLTARQWEYNIKMDLQKVGWGMDLTDLAQDRDGPF